MEDSAGPLTPEPPRPAPPSVARRRKWLSPKTVKLIRRIHLYLGLALVPWVLLYGATAVLFNHGDWFTQRHYRAVDPIEVTGVPTPEHLAKSAVTTLAVDGLELVPDTARFVGSLSFRGQSETHRARLTVAHDGAGGMLRMGPTAAKGPKWAGGLSDWKGIPEPIEADLKKNALAAANAQGAKLGSLKLRRYPSVRFQVRDQGTIRTVELEMDGEMEVSDGEGVAPLRNRLMRLHTLHGRPGYSGSRWWWSFIVDIMGIAMILWGFAGLIMWWTIRPTRRTGGLALAGGVSVICILAALLWGALGMA